MYCTKYSYYTLRKVRLFQKPVNENLIHVRDHTFNRYTIAQMRCCVRTDGSIYRHQTSWRITHTITFTKLIHIALKQLKCETQYKNNIIFKALFQNSDYCHSTHTVSYINCLHVKQCYSIMSTIVKYMYTVYE